MRMCGPNNVGKAVRTVPTLLHYALPSRNKRNVGSFWLKSLTGFKLCATILNNMQQGVQTDATCNIQHCWELLANNVTSICKRLKAWSPLLTASTVKKCHWLLTKGEIIRLAYRVAVAQYTMGVATPLGRVAKNVLRLRELVTIISKQ